MLLFFKNALFTILVPGTVAFYLPYAIGTRRLAVSAPGPTRLIAAAPLLLIGSAIYLWCLWDFAITGRGTPAPIDPPKELVVRGLYRTVRNPMYVGVLLTIAGWLALFQSWALLAYAAAVGALFHAFVVLVEEPMLQRRFGAAYDTYRRKVRRWWPGRPKRLSRASAARSSSARMGTGGPEAPRAHRAPGALDDRADAMESGLRAPPLGQAAWLHDALRDAHLGGDTTHGPAAADRAAREGETDRGVLDAIRYHSSGYAGWDDVGKMLYLADYLEPGRKRNGKERASLAARVPRQRDRVLKKIVAYEIRWRVRDGQPVNPLLIDFWNALNGGTKS